MTPQDFFMRIEAYRNNAGNLITGNGGFNIYRGMAHTISGYCEDLFALFLAQHLNRNDLVFWVDKVISIRLNGMKRSISFKPDIAIIRDNLLVNYFDIKTNMGWNRNFGIFLQNKDSFIKTVRGQSAWITSNGTRSYITISPQLFYQMVILYGWNINQNLLMNNLNNVAQLQNVNVEVLFPKTIPAGSYQTLNHGLYLDQSAFNRIYQSLP